MNRFVLARPRLQKATHGPHVLAAIDVPAQLGGTLGVETSRFAGQVVSPYLSFR